MTKKIKFSLISIYCVAILLLFSPFLKQVILIFQTQGTSIEQTSNTESLENVPLEAVQPPDLKDTLGFKKEQTYQAIGQIIIPKVEITLPVFPGLNNQQLLVGAGTLFPKRTAKNQNIVVVGHHLGRNSALFGGLLDLANGDDIYLEYKNDFHHYEVKQTKTVKETDLQVLNNRKDSEITLITCDKPTQTNHRFVVRGKLREKMTKESKQKVLTKKQVIKKRNSEKDLHYCIIIISLLFLCLLIGIRVIYKASK